MLVPAVETPPVADGFIRAGEWPAQGSQGGFVRAATLWERPAKATTVRLCRDAVSLHVAFECDDDAIESIGRSDVDNVWGNDVVEVLIQPPRGVRERWWCHVAVDPLGHVWLARENAIPEMPGSFKSDEMTGQGISCAARIGKDQWTVEMTIPLSDLEAGDDDWDGDWRGNFCRTSVADNGKACWSMTRAFQDPGRFGRLTPDDAAAAARSATSFGQALDLYDAARRQAAQEIASQGPVYEFAHAFNFGPAGRSTQKGYRQVDAACAYSAARGYGWLGGRGELETLVAQTVEDLGASQDAKAMPAGALASSWLAAAGPSDARGRVSHTFRVDVPDGEYKVHLLSGLIANEAFPHRRMFTVSCGDRKLTDIDIGHYMFARPFFRCLATNGCLEFTFDGPARITPDEATFDVDPNGMSKNYVPGWLVNALVIYPARDRRQAERQIASDELTLTHLPPDDLSRLEEVRQPPDADVAEPTAAETTRGFMVFERPLGRRLYPDSMPRRSEIRESLRVRVTPGEPAYFTFGLLPLRDLDAVSVTVSEFRGGSGTGQPKSLRIREAQYRPWLTYGSSQYATEPVFLDDFQHLDPDMNDGECRWFWISFRTPKRLLPGTYESVVTIAPRESEAFRLTLTLEVLPFQAVEVPFSYGGYLPGGYGMPGVVHSDCWGRAASDVGMNTFVLAVHSYRKEDRDRLRNQIALFMNNGVGGPFVIGCYFPEDINQALLKGEIPELPATVAQSQVAAARLLLRWMREENFPELIYTVMDEAHCKGEPYWTEQVRLLAAVKEAVPEILTAATESDRSSWRSREFLDVPLLFEAQDFRAYRLSPEEVARGKAVWCYPNQAMLGPSDINAGRFCTGWLAATTGLRGVVPWQIYGMSDYTESFLKNGLRSNYWFMFMARSVGGYRVEPRLTTVMGHIGIWDLRYAETLRSLVHEAENGGSADARAVAAEMKELLQRIDDTTKGSYMYYFENGYWKPEAFVTVRERVTDGIIKLAEAMGK